METRREFLSKAAFLASGATFSGELLGSIRRALAIAPDDNTSFWDAEHVVILMQENRSFDHVFGSLRGVRGFNDPRAIKLPNGNPVWIQTNSNGESYAPFRLNIKDTQSTWMGCLPHSRSDQVDARNDGKYDRWLDMKRSFERRYSDMPLTMGFYNRDDLPFYYELADAFTVCDQHFCSCLTGTTANRLYFWTGTIRSEPTAKSPANLHNSNVDHVTNVSWTTFPERLEDLGISWKVYQNEISAGHGMGDEEAAWLSNFGCNPLEFFSQFNVRLSPTYRGYLASTGYSLQAEIEKLEGKSAANGLSADDAKRLADSLQKARSALNAIEHYAQLRSQLNVDRLAPKARRLMSRAFTNNSRDPHYRELTEITYRDGNISRTVQVPKGDVLHQFRHDVERGELPTVSWIIPSERLSDHPGSAWYGAWYVAELLDILTRNPAVWKKTIFILTYDENDGYFDHAPPFVAPNPGNPQTGRVSNDIDASIEFVTMEDALKRGPVEQARAHSIGLGYRVPMIIASPWTRGGFVCSQVFDHTSTLQFLEELLSKKTGKDVREPNISKWRRTVCGDLTSAFQREFNDDIKHPALPRDAFVAQIHKARYKDLPTGYQKLRAADIAQIRRGAFESGKLPRQERGARPSCALPYELAVNGALAADQHRFVLTMEARTARFEKRAAGAPFTVYAHRHHSGVQVRNYAVSPGGRLTDAWSLSEFVDGAYSLFAYGPNGFYREFKGTITDPRVDILCDPLISDAGQIRAQVAIAISNRGKFEKYTVHIADETYGAKLKPVVLAAGNSMTIEVDCDKSFGWYDLSARIDECPTYARRFAGRVETGKASYSDPAMA